MPNQCKECAFISDSEANREPHNHLRAMICELSTRPFFCHEQLGNDHWQDALPETMTPAELHARGWKICEGWRQAVKQRNADGFYQKSTARIRRYLGEYALWLYEIGLTFIGVTGSPVHGSVPPLSFAYASKVDLRYSVRVEAELKRQIDRRWPRLPVYDPSLIV